MSTAPGYPAPPRNGFRLRTSLPAAPKWRPDQLRWVLFALLFLTISRFHQHYSFMMALRPALMLTAVALGFAILRPASVSMRDALKTWPSRVMLGLGALAILSGMFGIGMGSSFSFFLEYYSKVLLSWLLLVIVIRSAADIRFFMWAYVLASAFLVYLAIFVFQLSSFYGGAVNRLDDLYMYDSNDMGCIFSVTIPFALLLFQSSGRTGKVVTALILVGLAGASALGGSRGGLIGILVVGLAMLLFASDLSWFKRLAFVGVFATGLAAFAPPGYWKQMQTMTHLEDDYNMTDTYGRLKILQRGVGYVAAYPVFGVGAGNFGRAEGTISPLARDHVAGEQVMWVAPHNSFLQVAAEMGIPALLLWCSLIVGGIVGMRRMRRRMTRTWLSGDRDQRFLYLATTYIPTALVGFAVTSSFVSFAYLDIMPTLAALMSGMYLAIAAKMPAAPPAVPATPRWARRVGPNPAA